MFIFKFVRIFSFVRRPELSISKGTSFCPSRFSFYDLRFLRKSNVSRMSSLKSAAAESWEFIAENYSEIRYRSVTVDLSAMSDY